MLVGGLLGALTGCSDKGPKQPGPESFAAGTCRQIAPTVLSVGDLVYDVQHRGKTPKSVEPQLTSAEHTLRGVHASQPALANDVNALVTAIGFFRIGVDSNTYQSARADEVNAAQRALVGACTSTSPSPRGS